MKLFRYVVEERDEDHRIYFNLIDGKAVMKFAFAAEQARDVSESDHAGKVFTAGTSQSFVVPKESILSPSNPQCNNEWRTCVFSIGVKCLSGDVECHHTLKVTDS